MYMCAGESHPDPVRVNGSHVGRGEPGIGVFEALIDGVGKVRYIRDMRRVAVDR
jgi:hypothetical protein